MTAEQQIEKQITEDFEKFRNEVYKGSIAVPENIIELFKAGVMALAPQAHKISGNKIQSIASMRVSELSNQILNEIIMVIVNTPPKKLYKDFETAVEGQIKFEKFILSYNLYIEDFQKRLEMKRVNLNAITKGVRNPLKIIPPNAQA